MLTRIKESIECRYRWLTRPFLKDDSPIVQKFLKENFIRVKYRDYRTKFAITDELGKLDFGGRSIVGMFWASIVGPIPDFRVWVRLFEHYEYLDQNEMQVVGYSMVWHFSDSKAPTVYNSIYHSDGVFSSRELSEEFKRMAVNVNTVKTMRMSELGIFISREEEKK